MSAIPDGLSDFAYPSPTEAGSRGSVDVWKLIEEGPEPECGVSRLEIPPSEVGKVIGEAAVQACRSSLAPACSKGGIPLEERKVLGHHMDKAHRSAFTYGRDNAAPALRSLCSVLKKIKQGDFRPDSTRSGRFREHAQEAQVLESASPHEREATPDGSVEPTELGSQSVQDDSSSDSWIDSASDADGELDPEDKDLEEVDNTVLLNLVMPNLKPTRFSLSSDMRSWKHRQSGIQHIQNEDASKFLCGRRILSVQRASCRS